MDIASISNNVLGEASQAMDSGVFGARQCPTVMYYFSNAFWTVHS